ncbi:hypothetical protein CPB84DRAFT_1793551 [Gymnopilus junonius]|uniref:Uncharacterized protein n=1 Tax=Gymnopilus junonius TaxID=109634 RepID=A0A9P5NEL8_GYMJU|nr:hypothetical protein CPB84DRAFT_1793551 [Gymnopilus junonius]
MPVKPAETSQWFIRLLFLYFSPALSYYLIRLITNWHFLPLLSTTSSSLLACATSFLVLLLLVIPEYLEYGPNKQPPEFLFIAIPELHYLACLFLSTICEFELFHFYFRGHSLPLYCSFTYDVLGSGRWIFQLALTHGRRPHISTHPPLHVQPIHCPRRDSRGARILYSSFS